MILLERTLGQNLWLGRRQLLLLIMALGTALALGWLAASHPVLAVGAALVMALAFAILAWPDISTLVVIFILYSNAAVVAVRFHGVPTFIGASVPALLLIPLAYHLIFRRRKLVITPVLPLLLLFLLIQTVGMFFSAYRRISLESLLTYVIEGIGLYFLVINVVRTPTMLRRVTWVLLLVGAGIGALVLYQQVSETVYRDYGGFAQIDGKVVQGEVVQRRAAGPIGEQNYYAQFMLLLVPIGIFRFFSERSLAQRALSVAAVALIVLGAMLSFSRGGAVGLGLMLLIMTFMRYIKLYQIAVMLLALVLLLQAVPEFGSRLLPTPAAPGEEDAESADTAIQGRSGAMLAAWQVFIDYPIIGVGPGVFKYYYQTYVPEAFHVHEGAREAHNIFLGIAAETGMLGLACFLAIIFVMLRDLTHVRKRWMQRRPELANMATGFMLAIVTYLTTGMFLSLAYQRYFWLMMALAGAASYIVYADASVEGELNEKATRDEAQAPLRETTSR